MASSESALGEFVIKRFSETDLKWLCEDLGVDYENLEGYGKAGKVLDLIRHRRRHGESFKLICGILQKRRPLAADLLAELGYPSDIVEIAAYFPQLNKWLDKFRESAEWTEAIGILEALQKDFPRDCDVRELLCKARVERWHNTQLEAARDALERDDWRSAISVLEDVRARLPDDSEISQLLCQAHIARERWRDQQLAAARDALERGDWATAVNVLELVLAEFSGDEQAKTLLCKASQYQLCEYREKASREIAALKQQIWWQRKFWMWRAPLRTLKEARVQHSGCEALLEKYLAGPTREAKGGFRRTLGLNLVTLLVAVLLILSLVLGIPALSRLIDKKRPTPTPSVAPTSTLTVAPSPIPRSTSPSILTPTPDACSIGVLINGQEQDLSSVDAIEFEARAGAMLRIEVCLRDSSGHKMSSGYGEYQWSFQPPDPKNEAGLGSGNAVLNYVVPERSLERPERSESRNIAIHVEACGLRKDIPIRIVIQ